MISGRWKWFLLIGGGYVCAIHLRASQESEWPFEKEEDVMVVKKRTPAKKSSATASKSKTKGQTKVHTVMKEYKEGELHSGSKTGPKVKSRKQAVAIALSEARKSGAKVPKKKSSSASTKKSTSTKKKTTK